MKSHPRSLTNLHNKYKKDNLLNDDSEIEFLKSTNNDEKIEISLNSSDEIILLTLANGLEKEIDKSLDLNNESFMISENFINEMAASVGGFEYENHVLKAIKKAGISGKITKSAGADANSADADIKIKDSFYNVEVKLDGNAQMGGSSVRFGKNGISFTKPLQPDTEIILRDAVATKATALNKFISFISKQSPKEINQKVISIPFSCTKKAWEKAQKNNLLVNVKIESSTDFITKHYAKKGIFYIQIGGAGLFYMAGNPANLPVPKLDGKINVEIRTARSGSKKLSNGVDVVGGGIRVQGRLKTKGKSPYTLDNVDSIMALLKVIK